MVFGANKQNYGLTAMTSIFFHDTNLFTQQRTRERQVKFILTKAM